MGKNKAPEKERPMPFSMGLPIFDEATGKYVVRKPPAESLKPAKSTTVKLRDMTPFHKGYDAVHKHKRARVASSSSDLKGKRSDPTDFLNSEPAYNRSLFLGPGDGRNPLVYNQCAKTYERLSFNEFGTFESQTGRDPGFRTGNYGLVHGTADQRGIVRQKNGGLAADNPVVLFPGEPLAVAERKARELGREFPGVPLDQALAQKKRKRAAPEEDREIKRTKSSKSASSSSSNPKVDLIAWFGHEKGSSQGRIMKGKNTTAKIKSPYRPEKKGPQMRPTKYTSTATTEKTGTTSLSTSTSKEQACRAPSAPRPVFNMAV